MKLTEKLASGAESSHRLLPQPAGDRHRQGVQAEAWVGKEEVATGGSIVMHFVFSRAWPLMSMRQFGEHTTRLTR